KAIGRDIDALGGTGAPAVVHHGVVALGRRGELTTHLAGRGARHGSVVARRPHGGGNERRDDNDASKAGLAGHITLLKVYGASRRRERELDGEPEIDRGATCEALAV